MRFFFYLMPYYHLGCQLVIIVVSHVLFVPSFKMFKLLIHLRV